MGREQQLSDAFVGLADTLGDDFDVIDLFDRLAAHCVALTGAEAAGIMTADGRGRLRVVAASQERAAFLELLQLQSGKGPCLECYRTGVPMVMPRIGEHRLRWPELVPAIIDAGFAAMATVPLRLHENVIGAVNTFYAVEEPQMDADMHLTQALSDVAALAMLHWPVKVVRPQDVLTRLQVTITNKVAIEQAKGVLAEYGRIPVEDAGAALRIYARRRRTRVSDAARAVVRQTLPHTPCSKRSRRTSRHLDCDPSGRPRRAAGPAMGPASARRR